MIRYSSHSITECKLIDKSKLLTDHDGETIYELSHWWTSDKSPQYSGRVHDGYFKTYEEAENNHNEMLINGLLKDKE